LRLLDFLFQQPIVTVRLVEENLQCAYVTASKTVEQFVELGFLKEITGWQRNRLYRYEPYLALFQPLKITTQP
jgi:Fic family protein